VAARVGNGGAPNDGGYDGDSSSEEHANGNSPGGPSGGSSSSSRFGSRGFDLGSMREPRFTRGAGQGDHGPWQEGSTGKAPADASSSNASEKNTDSEVQEALADILNMEVRKEEVKQEILADLELKKEQLRLIGQELADDFEKEIALDKIRTELASNMSLADTMSRFQELEDEVQALRDSVAADKEELLDWEESTAAARSRSLFFKELYTVKRPKGDDEHGRCVAAVHTRNPRAPHAATLPHAPGRAAMPCTRLPHAPGCAAMPCTKLPHAPGCAAMPSTRLPHAPGLAAMQSPDCPMRQNPQSCHAPYCPKRRGHLLCL